MLFESDEKDPKRHVFPVLESESSATFGSENYPWFKQFSVAPNHFALSVTRDGVVALWPLNSIFEVSMELVRKKNYTITETQWLLLGGACELCIEYRYM